MGHSTQNIKISGTDFPAKLARCRIALNLSKTALAKLSGLTYRTIHDLESGRRDRIQEKTLMLLATALDVSLEELLNGNGSKEPDSAIQPPSAPTNDRLRFRTLVTGLTTLAIVGILGFATFQYSITHATFVANEHSIETSYGLFGNPFWRAEFSSKISFCRLAPWDPQQILVGLDFSSLDQKKLYCFQRSTGKVLWQNGPDTHDLVEAFGSQAIQPGGFSCARSRSFDWDGDSVSELLVQFEHQNQHPTVFWVIDQTGSVLGQYAHWGPIIDWLTADIDGQPGQELMAVGRFDGSVQPGGSVLVLDRNHFSGGSVDPLNFPQSSVADSSLVRTLIPHFPEAFDQHLNTEGMGGYSIRILETQEGEPLIKIDCGYSKYYCLVLIFDVDLKILRNHSTDHFEKWVLEMVPDLVQPNTGPLDPAWRHQWLQGCQRFGSGPSVLAQDEGGAH